MRTLPFIRNSIRRKLVLLFVTVMALLISTVGIAQYGLTSSMLRDDLETYSLQTLEQANLNIQRYFKEYEQAFLFVEGSEEFLTWTRQRERFTSTYLRLSKLIDRNSVQPFIMQHPEVLSLSMLNPYGNELRYTTSAPFRLDYSLRERMTRMPMPGGRIQSAVVHRSDDYDGAAPVVLSLTHQWNHYGSNSYIVMDIAVTPLLRILQRMDEATDGAQYIVDGQGRIVVHAQEERIFEAVSPQLGAQIAQADSDAFLDRASNRFVVFAAIPDTQGWTSVIELPYDQAARTIYLVRDFTVSVTVLGIGVTVLLLFVFSSSITGRIVKLKKQLLQTKLGRIEPGPELGGVDEIAQLGHAFNSMLRRLDASVDELADARAREQTALFTAVQSQIHSHFLYNSLETINAMAGIAGMRTIEQAVLSLSAMIRYSSRIREVAVPLRDELEHTRHYLYMTGIRFERISYTYRVDPEALEVRCPKLILQPVLENACKHNVETAGRSLHLDLSVRARFGRYVHIRIRDDGAGMPDAVLHRLRGSLASASLELPAGDSGIGLANVAYRLSQFYAQRGCGGARIGVYHNREGTGITVAIVVPMIPA
ncbi:histidine kinase [Paenibacillus sp. IB182496]|uniref:Histidine kinase n=1 Tax=Paenibacillus sabuli TaxID=2772509 RepID=A0A927BQA9_9BACL|nr:histidine kinase [Paenibacillus sabuli]MBD2843589.1 histidine kinase [Paenibacillus sabuli]